MVDQTPIRVGIIGFGLAGRIFHEPFLAANPRFRIDVIATSDPERQKQVSDLGYSFVATPDDLLARAGDLDLVVLATPPQTHLEQGTRALEAGAAIVIDKPFAASVAEAEQLIATSERVGKPLIVFQNRRWDGDFLTVKQLVASGRLGSIHRFETTFERFAGKPRKSWRQATSMAQGGGITFDLGSHLIDQALQLFGPAELTNAEVRATGAGATADDDAVLTLTHANGVVTHVSISSVAAQSGPRFRVLGSDDAYTVYGLDVQEDALKAGQRPLDPGYGEAPESAWGVVGGGESPLEPVPTLKGDYSGFYAGVAAAVADGGPVPVDPRDSLATVRIIEQAHTHFRG
ncbi:MAG: putative oxidoreductase [Glaciihabitans sp.]|nr:putative oxidoreductase [Glaciihabitans sp.]